MSLDGPRAFRSALLIEAAANIGSIFPLILSPQTCLSYLIKSPSVATPAAQALTQWLGAIIILPTVPLLLSYPEPTSSEPPSLVTARRRMTYLSLMISEIALGSVTAYQYLCRDSGMTDRMLLIATVTFSALVSLRAYVLFVKPGWMEAKATAGKGR